MKYIRRIVASFIVGMLVNFSCSLLFAQCLTEQLLISNSSSTPHLTDVDFIDSNNGIVVGTKVLTTTNGGTTWNIFEIADSTIGRFVNVFMHSPMHATAISYGGKVFKTTDGGVSWNYLGSPPVSSGNFSFWDSNHGLCVGDKKIFRTQDEGRSWQVVYSNAVYGGITTVTCANSVYAFAVVDINKIFRTTDKGNSWTFMNQPTGGFLTGIIFADSSHGFALGARELFNTTNGGYSWSVKTYSNNIYPSGLNYFNNQIWFGEGGLHFFSSTDGGSTWSMFSNGNYDGWVWSDYQFLPSGNIILLRNNTWTKQSKVTAISKNNCSTIVSHVFPKNGERNVTLQHSLSTSAFMYPEWRKIGMIFSPGYLLQLSKDSLFTNLNTIEKIILTKDGQVRVKTILTELSASTTYFWRVSSMYLDRTLAGWSDTWQFTTANGKIQGNVFNDVNKNSIRDFSEQGLEKKIIRMNGDGQNEIYTDSMGNYNFFGLDSGSYQIIHKPYYPWKPTTPIDTHSVYISINDSIMNLNYGQYYPWNKASGIVYYDENENGVKDSTETGLPNWNVRLKKYSTGELRTTDSLGYFSYNNLELDKCSLFVIPNYRWEKITPRLVDAYTVEFNTYDRQISTLHFGVHPIPQRVKFPLLFHDDRYYRIQTIQFGVRPDATFGLWNADINASKADFSEGEDEIPSPIPESFDVRFVNPHGSRFQFGNGSWVDMRPYYSSTQQDTYKIIFQTGFITSGSYPLTFQWNRNQIDSLYAGSVFLRDMNNVEYDLRSLDSLVIYDSTIQHLMLYASSPILPPLSIWSNNEFYPTDFFLEHNYPNPFNPTTTLSFVISQSSLVTLKVFNVLGQEVATMLNREALDAGDFEYEFNATDLPSGIYFYRLEAQTIAEKGVTSETFVSVKKMVLMR